MTKAGTRFKWALSIPFMTAVVAAVIPASGAAQRVDRSPHSATPQMNGETPELIHAQDMVLAAPPPTAQLSETKCDTRGDIYVVQSGGPTQLFSSGVLSTAPVTELSPDSKRTTAYPVPRLDGYVGVIRLDFDVTKDGKVYSLLEGLDLPASGNNGPPTFFIAKYRDDGGLDSWFKLDTKDRSFQPFRVAAFQNGNLLVSGTIARKGEPLKPFTAVFDDSGQLAANVELPHFSEPKPPETTGKGEPESQSDRAVSLSSSSFLVSGPDGNVYLLDGYVHPRIYAVSSSGDVVRDFDVTVPARGLAVTNVAWGGNQILISFGHIEGVAAPDADAKSEQSIIALVSPQSGEVSALYKLPASSTSVPACATSSDSFLFLGATADHQHEEIERYSSGPS